MESSTLQDKISDFYNNNGDFSVFDEKEDNAQEQSNEQVIEKETTNDLDEVEQEGSNQDDNTDNDDQIVKTENEVSEDDNKKKGLLTATISERKKRQALEQKYEATQKELSELKAQMQVLLSMKNVSEDKTAEKQQPAKIPDPLDDGYNDFILAQINNAKQEVKVELSRENALEKWGDDYLEAEQFFLKNSDDNLKVQAIQSKNPAKYIYDLVQNHKKNQKLSDPNYEKNLEEQIREKILKELQPAKNGETKKLNSVSIMGNVSEKIPESKNIKIDVDDIIAYYDSQ